MSILLEKILQNPILIYLQKFYSAMIAIKIDVNLPKCPRCGIEVTKIVKEWDYSIFHVKRFNCEACDKTFGAYFKKDKLSHTIPKTLSKSDEEIRVLVEKARIIKYLKRHDKATTDEIAQALNLPVVDVLNMLIELESEGIIQSIDDA